MQFWKNKRETLEEGDTRGSGGQFTPDFIVIGAQKCGTSSLFDALSGHPDIVSPRRKEIHYFDGGLIPYGDEDLYREMFPQEEALRGKLTHEASPSYLYHPEVATRLAARRSRPKLIVILRNPVDRAFSAWKHFRRLKDKESLAKRMMAEQRSFEEAVEEEASRLSTTSYFTDRRGYLKRGFYAEQLTVYLRFFELGDDLHVFFYEELFAEGGDRRILRDILSMAGADPNFEIQLPRRNASKDGETVPLDLRGSLSELYGPANERLEYCLGRSLPWD